MRELFLESRIEAQTAQALQVNEVAGAFSGLAMGLNALATAILLPLLLRLIL